LEQEEEFYFGSPQKKGFSCDFEEDTLTQESTPDKGMQVLVSKVECNTFSDGELEESSFFEDEPPMFGED